MSGRSNIARSIVRNIPNALSAYRLGMAPLICFLAVRSAEKAFLILILVSLLTDVLDGLIARTFRLQSAFGAKLDSIADDATYIAAFTGVIVFQRASMGADFGLLVILIAMVALSSLVHLAKFGRFPSLHLYSFRVCGYLQAGFLIVLFTHGFDLPLFWVVFVTGIASCAEVIAVTLLIREPVSNARGLYWVLKSLRSPAI